MRLVSEAQGAEPAPRERALDLAPKSVPALLAALRDFGAAWGVLRHPAPAGRHVGEAALAFVFCAGVIAAGYLADAAVAHWALAEPAPVLAIFETITLFGDSSYIFALCILVAVAAALAARRSTSRRITTDMNGLAGRATFVFAVNAVGGILAQLLKHVAGRARPKFSSLVGPFHFDLFSIRGGFESFPSGHTITVFATAAALSFFVPRLRVPLFLFAALVAVSRLMVEQHYLSDVLAGMIFGIGTAIYLRRAFARRGLVFRQAGERILLRRAGSPATALLLLVGRARR